MIHTEIFLCSWNYEKQPFIGKRFAHKNQKEYILLYFRVHNKVRPHAILRTHNSKRPTWWHYKKIYRPNNNTIDIIFLKRPNKIELMNSGRLVKTPANYIVKLPINKKKLKREHIKTWGVGVFHVKNQEIFRIIFSSVFHMRHFKESLIWPYTCFVLEVLWFNHNMVLF